MPMSLLVFGRWRKPGPPQLTPADGLATCQSSRILFTTLSTEYWQSKHIYEHLKIYHEAGIESVIFAPLIEDLVDLADLVDLVDLVGLVDLADQADQADLARFQIAITVQYVS